MAVTPAQLARLRRMVNEPSTTPYSDVVLTGYIEDRALTDADGRAPDHGAWVASYDLHSAAADIWEEKASIVAQDFNFNADGGSFERSQVYEQYMQQARYHRSRRAVGSIAVAIHPPVAADVPLAANWNDPYA